jgi:flagellar hook-length control protein FliK
LQATQPKADANKADDTSPFALLVGSVQAKPAAQQKDAQGKDGQSTSDKQADTNTASHGGNPNTATQTATQAAVKPVKAGKGDDKNSKSKDGDNSDTSGNTAAAATLQQASSQPAAAPQVAITATNTAAATADDDAGDDESQVTAAGATGAATSSQANAQVGQTAQNAQAAAQDTQAANQTAASQAAASQTANQAAASQAASQAAASQTANQATTSPATSQAAASQAAASQAAAQTATSQAAGSVATQGNGQTKAQGANQPSGQGTSQSGGAQAQALATNQDTVQQAAVQPDGVRITKPWQAKPQSASDSSNSKTDSSQASDPKSADVKQAATPQPPATNDVTAAKPADMANSTLPLIGGAMPQGQQPQAGGDASAVTQNVQVQTTPTPNMPALAVEIAAKSQSGAKQFDIRLDPPELGRVEVRLSIDATGKASAHLSADQPQTLDLLQKDAPTLTRALRDAGLDVSQNGLNFSLRQQSGDAGTGNNQGRGTGGRSFTLTATSNIDASSAGAAYSAQASGRLDIRV